MSNMLTAKIRKIKNFEGYWFRCSRCGREIKHAFTVNGEGTYGSDCVYEVAGSTGAYHVDRIMKNVRAFKKFSPATHEQIKHYAKAYSCSVEDIVDGFIHTGNYKPLD